MATFSWDLIVVAAVVLISFLWSYTKGQDFIITTILGTYVAGVTMMFAPLIANFDVDMGIELYQTKFLIFVLFSIFFTWSMATNGYFEPYIVPSGWEMGVFAFLFAGLFLSITVGFVPEEVFAEFSPITKLIFGHDAVLTGWIVAPMVVLLFIRGEA